MCHTCFSNIVKKDRVHLKLSHIEKCKVLLFNVEFGLSPKFYKVFRKPYRMGAEQIFNFILKCHCTDDFTG